MTASGTVESMAASARALLRAELGGPVKALDEELQRTILHPFRQRESLVTGEKFDRIVSLEAVERVGVKNLSSFFGTLLDHMVDDGLFLLQWTGLRRQLRPEDLMWGLFMNKHVFPGADAALEKPSDATSLVDVVERLLSQKAKPAVDGSGAIQDSA